MTVHPMSSDPLICFPRSGDLCSRSMDWREQLRSLRIEAGGQKVLADRLGVTTQTISRWENGETSPSEVQAERLKREGIIVPPQSRNPKGRERLVDRTTDLERRLSALEAIVRNLTGTKE